MANEKGYPFRMPAVVFEALKKAAASEGRSVNNLLLKVLTDWLREHGHLR